MLLHSFDAIKTEDNMICIYNHFFSVNQLILNIAFD